MRLCGSHAVIVGVLTLLAPGLVASPACAGMLSISVSGSGLVVHGIPLPDGAEPSLAANLSLENLRAMAPESGDLGTGHVRAVVYELQRPAPPDAVASFYRHEMTRPVALALPPRVQQGKRAATDDGVRVLRFVDMGGYLAIRSQEAPSPSRVTVAMVEGSAVPAAVLKAVDSLSTGGAERKPIDPPPLLSPPSWEISTHFDGSRLQVLQRWLASKAPGPDVNIMRELLNQARSVDQKNNRVTPEVPVPVILAAFRQEARRRDWRLVSVEAEAAQEVIALYRFPDDSGMAMLRAGRGQPKNLAPPGAPVTVPAATTEISLLEVKGPIHFQALFRPAAPHQPRRSLPAFGVPAPRGPSSVPGKR